ncbi:double-strand break repair protein AddB [Pseudogemmobacter faecipullorum]
MMFRDPGPRLYGLAPGVDFPARLVEGVIRRLEGQPPEALARVTIWLNTQRMRRHVREAFLKRGAGFLPRLRVVTDPGQDPLLTGELPSVSKLGRRLELAVLIDHLLQAEPDLAPRQALYDLSDSLANLMDEMRAEDVAPDALNHLDIEGHAAHWARTRRFVSLVGQFFGDEVPPDSEARLRLATLTLLRAWAENPVPDPVIVAGSTGSRGTTALLMRAVARLPQGALLLPGFDFDQPEAVWQELGVGAEGIQEDHPQYRYDHLCRSLDLRPVDVRRWDQDGAPDPARGRLVSLALRPAPVTDQWISEGPELGDLGAATRNLTLIEAPHPRAEAEAIALRLRQAVAEGKSAALLTPDRDLTRRVTAALDRWALKPDDSAGQPLLHSPPGRLLRLIARAMGRRLSADQCLTLLKHPLTFSGSERGPHLRLSLELELELRRKGPAFPDSVSLRDWANRSKDPFAVLWAERLGAVLDALAAVTPAPLTELIATHRRLTEMLARGTGDEGEGQLWAKEAGQAAIAAMEELAKEAPAGLMLTPSDYSALSDSVLSRGQVRSLIPADERIVILGAQEARVVGADLVILAGLSEGIWPAKVPPDPWLNRKMRMELGLLLPERRVGLSAHDFQMAVGAKEVVLSRARRDAEAETVPSRWLNRLTNLLDGLPETGGRAALAAMRARGEQLIREGEAVSAPIVTPRSGRPSPRPPVAVRPNRLSLTEIEKLIRDPYAIYARHVLKLNPLMPLRPSADARLRGEILHKVPETLLKRGLPETVEAAEAALLAVTDEVLERDVAWPAMRAIWRMRMEDLARPFVEGLLTAGGQTVSMEKKYAIEMKDLGFTLVGKPDRMDILPDGRLKIIDYKTGSPPSPAQQEAFAKQLHLAALMANLGAFPELGPHDDIEIAYIRLARDLKTVETRLGPEELEKVLNGFRRLILAYREPGRGYSSRRAMVETRDRGDYDDLARYGEWEITDPARPEDVP